MQLRTRDVERRSDNMRHTRRKSTTNTEPPTAGASPQPVIIKPNSIYSLKAAQAALGLKKGCLPREIRLKRLRVHKRANRKFILGEELLAWLRDAGPGESPERKANPQRPGRRAGETPAA
jgi:hypothetical protein